MYKAVLFDLDGTLTDSGEGIIKSVAYALEKMGKPEEDLNKLRGFVGPPLKEMFMSFSGMTEEEALEAIGYYRERFVPIGIYENSVYPGIEDVLSFLREKGYRLAIASSKPEPFVHTVLTHFGIEDYFEVIVGSGLNETRTSKEECIEEAIRRLSMEGKERDILMVGDTVYDVKGARTIGMDVLAVTYGYGEEEDLVQSEPTALARTPMEILDFFY